MTTPMFILGAPDPEMAAIEAVVRAAGHPVRYATHGGARVRPETAYKADPIDVGDIVALAVIAVLVECQPAYVIDSSCTVEPMPRDVPCVTIDHHRPGDPGFGRPPAEFLSASSLGQVLLLLAHECGYEQTAFTLVGPADAKIWHLSAWTDGRGNRVGGSTGYHVRPEHVLCAAADHCLAAAYRGECPGVDPEALMAWRAESRAEFQKRTVAAVLADVERAREVLRTAPRASLAGVEYAVIHGSVPELPEAAAREGVPFEAHLDGKTVLQAAPAELVAAWMAAHHGAYGDPARGFAGWQS